MTLRKLRRGQWPVQDTIDLHGHTSEEARRFWLNFCIMPCTMACVAYV
jgi:DNA-nicking Smr family endonuclease